MTALISELISRFGEDRVAVQRATRQALSKDYYWYSPVLSRQLDGKVADVVVYPVTSDDIVDLVKLARQYGAPITARGAGTGNYGQAVPLQGGILLDFTRMNRLVEVRDGAVQVESGVKMGVLEKELRGRQQELCIFPSTYMKSTCGGFVSGGSGGIGSITWGALWDGNVIELQVVTAEQEPRIVNVRGTDLINYIHSYGTTGIITQVVFRTTPRVEWTQCLVSFAQLRDSLDFSKRVAQAQGIKKRSVSTCEWPIPSYFLPLKSVIRAGEHVVLLEVEDVSMPLVRQMIANHGGLITYLISPEKYHQGTGLSEFTWNHTTLWALKAHDNMTYLQGSFSLHHYYEQILQIKDRFGDEFYSHFDWMKNSGELIPQQIPLVRFTTEARLNEMISFCTSIGVKIFNPHTPLLDQGGWEAHVDAVVRQKAVNDPMGILNPGKIGVLSTAGRDTSHSATR